jgi:hypothetical protein
MFIRYNEIGGSMKRLVSCADIRRSHHPSPVRKNGSSMSALLSYGILWVCLLTTSIAFGQNAELSGKVTDDSGATIPAAKIEFVNEQTKTALSILTDRAGFYYIAVPPGGYSISVSAQGFKTQNRIGVKIDVGQASTLDFPLQVGSAQETVNVSSTTQELQTSFSVGNVVTDAEIERLPVNGRNYTTLELLMPGAGDISKSQNDGTDSGTNLFSINGQRPQDNNYLLDGIENDFFHKSSPGGSPPFDSIAEFRVATDNSAEYGRSVGAAVSLLTKSGSDRFHGSVYEYLRNDELDANNYFSNFEGLGRTPLHQNLFGASLGGPLYPLTKLSRLRKTFFFVNYDGLRKSQADTLISTVPTQDERNGNFAALGHKIYDPLTSTYNASGKVIRQQFSNNQIPSNRLDPAALAYLSLVPLPNRTGIASNYVNNQSLRDTHDIFVGRVDHSFNDANSVFFRVMNQSVLQTTPQSNPNFSEQTQFNVLNLALGWTSILSPTSILQVHLGYDLPSGPDFTRNTLGVTGTQFLSQNNINLFSLGTLYNFIPTITATGDFSIAESGGTDIDEIYQVSVDYEREFGRTSWKSGFSIVPRKYFHSSSSSLTGSATFNQSLTNSASDSTSGSSTASFLLDYPSSVSRGQGNGIENGRQIYTAYYTQLHRRVTDRLTVDAGLRYEFFPPIVERDNHFGTLWVHNDPSSGVLEGTLLWAGINPLPDLVTGVVNGPPNRAGFGRALEETDYNNLAPRLGAAFRINDKTIVRGGAGVYYNSTFFQESQDKSGFYPYNSQQTFTANSSLLPNLHLEDAGPSYTDTSAIGGYAQVPTNRTPYSYQYNLFVQRDIAYGITTEIGYVGSQNRKQIGYVYFNTAPVPGPGSVQPRRLLPAYGDVLKGANDFSSNYNALQIQAKKRYHDGLDFTANYTYSRSLDYQSSLAEFKTQNPFNMRADYSRSSFDLTHVFDVSYVYDLPFGRGRKYAGDLPRFTDAFLGGWSLEGITRLETGPPDNATSGQDRANVGTSVQRPDLVGRPNDGPKTIHQWFNTSAFVLPAQYTFGSAGAYIVQAPGLKSWDLAIYKSFSIVEHQVLDFRAEAFDFPNLTNFSDPNTGLASTSFGTITSTRIANRQLQLSLRYSF